MSSLSTDIHLDDDSIHIPQHQTNWRIRAIDSLSQSHKEDLHYSLVFTVSADDLSKLRDTLTGTLKKCADIIRPSKEQELAVLNLDLFRLR